MSFPKAIPRARLLIILTLSPFFCETASAFPGEAISSFSVPGDCPSDLAWDQGCLWLSDWRQALIYQLDPRSGEVLQVLPSPGPCPQGLAWGKGRLFVALCRANGLPARFEAGLLIRGDWASVDRDNHRWAEVYLPNYGWVPFDPSVGSGRSPADVAQAVGNSKVTGRPHPGLFVTTHGGGDSEYLGWNYNSYATYKFSGTCEVEEERYFIWRPGGVK